MSGKEDHVVFCPLCAAEGRRKPRTFNSLRALNIHLKHRHSVQYRYAEFGGSIRRHLGVKPADL